MTPSPYLVDILFPSEPAIMTKEERDKIRADLKIERWRATWTRGKILRSCKAQIARLEAALRASAPPNQNRWLEWEDLHLLGHEEKPNEST